MSDDIKITRTDLWATPIWQYYVSDDVVNFSQIISEIYEIKKNQQSRFVSNQGGWQSDFIKSENTELFKLMNYIKKNVYQCYDDLQVKKNFYNIFFSYWININSFGHNNSVHLHPNSIISGCVYIKVPKNSGNLLLHSNLTNKYFFASYTNSNTDFASDKIEFFAEEKKVIMFPSFLSHSVDNSNSVEDRISIAFNCSFYDKG